MAKIPECPYCKYEINTLPKATSIKCPRCSSVIRIFNGKLNKSEEVPPEVAYCFTAIFANIARTHDGNKEEFLNFLEEFLRNQNLTKKQYEYLIKFYKKESKGGFSFGHESNKNLISRLKNVIDDTCASMPMSEQDLYEDSSLRMIISFMKSGGNITEEENKVIQQYKKTFEINEKRYLLIYNEEEAKKREDEKKVKKRDINEIFEDIQKAMLQKVSRKDFVSNLVLAYKRPFIIKQSNAFLKNIMIIFSSENILVKDLMNDISEEMRKEKLLKGVPQILDFNMYKKEESLGNFVNTYIEKANGNNGIIVFENLELGSESCKEFVKNLCKYGRIEVNTPKGVIEIKTNGEYFVFITEESESEFENIIGKDIFDNIRDIIKITEFTPEEIEQMVKLALDQFKTKCKKELDITITYTPEITQYLNSIYNNSTGIKGINLLIENKIFEPITEYKLKGKFDNKLQNVLTAEEGFMMICVGEEKILLDDSNQNKVSNKLIAVKSKLKSIVGLDEVKEYLLKLESNIAAQKMRERAGMKVAPLPLNMIFTGNPGTGKTTMARIVAEYLSALGMLERGQFIEVTRADLVGSHSRRNSYYDTRKINPSYWWSDIY